MCKVRAAILFSLVATINGDVIDSALQSDDQCDMADAECSFNALQLRGLKEEMELEENNEEGEGWLKDISTKTKNHSLQAHLGTTAKAHCDQLPVPHSFGYLCELHHGKGGECHWPLGCLESQILVAGRLGRRL